MQENIKVAESFFDALKEKDLDKALTYMVDEPVMDTPMGTRTGKKKVRDMLGVIANIGGGNAQDIKANGGDVSAVAPSPMGDANLLIEFQEGLIQKVTATL